MSAAVRPTSVLVLGLEWPAETFVANVLAGQDPERIAVTVACATAPWGARPRHWRPQIRRSSGVVELAVGAAASVAYLAGAPRPQRRLARSMLDRHAPVASVRELSTLGRWDVVYFPWTVGPAGFPHVAGLGAAIVVSCRGAQVNVAPLDPERAGIGQDVRRALAGATLVHCVSEDIVGAAVEFGLDRSRARVIRPAVDVRRFAPAGPVIEPPGPRRALELVTTGSLYWRKGTEDLLVAVRRAVDAGTDVGLTIIGRGQEEARVRFTVGDLDLADRVRLLGRRPPDDVAAILRGADAFVLPSLSEGISNAVLEGMASALPILTTRAGGMGEAVTDGVEGRLLEIGDPDGLGAAIVALAADPEGARAMGARGRARVERDFDGRDQVEAYAALFEEAAALGAPTPERTGAR